MRNKNAHVAGEPARCGIPATPRDPFIDEFEVTATERPLLKSMAIRDPKLSKNVFQTWVFVMNLDGE
jgi:hypothetical protein